MKITIEFELNHQLGHFKWLLGAHKFKRAIKQECEGFVESLDGDVLRDYVGILKDKNK